MNSSLPMPYQAHSVSQNGASGAATSCGAGNRRFGARPNKPAKLSSMRAGRSAAYSALQASLHEESFELDVLVATSDGWRRPFLRISSDWESGCVRDVAISFCR